MRLTAILFYFAAFLCLLGAASSQPKLSAVPARGRPS